MLCMELSFGSLFLCDCECKALLNKLVGSYCASVKKVSESGAHLLARVAVSESNLWIGGVGVFSFLSL